MTPPAVDLEPIKARLAAIKPWKVAGTGAVSVDAWPRAHFAHAPVRFHRTDAGKRRAWRKAHSDMLFLLHAPADIEALLTEVAFWRERGQ